MRTITYDTTKLLADAKNHVFVIPRFQREFVWRQPQVKLLIDSIARNYPIGSLLMLAENNPKDPFLAARGVQASLSAIETNEDLDFSGRFYVLDGQQRLTSIVRVLLQSSPEHFYYFDLLKLKEFDRAEASTDWIVIRDRKRSMPNRYLRSDAIIEPEKCQILVEEFFESGDTSISGDRPAQRAASAKVNRIFETIRNFQIPLVVIDRDESTEGICRIFETINSTGTRLTTFDLAVARFFPTPPLHTLWEESKQTYQILTRYDVDGERVLQVIALQHAVFNRLSSEATRTAILGLSRDVISQRWHEAARRLSEAYEWAEQRGVAPRWFPNEALMVPLAVFFSYIDDRWRRTQPSFSSHLERWYLASCLQQGARQASNYRVAQSTQELIRWKQDGILPPVPTVTLDCESILKLRPSDSRYRTIMAFVRHNMRCDLISEEVLRADDVEDHHIFPRATAQKNGLVKTDLDSIGNRILVSRETNRFLGDQLPREYLGRVLRDAESTGTLTHRLERLRAGGIVLPGSVAEAERLLDVRNGRKFIESRIATILEHLQQFLGPALHRGEEIEEDVD